MKTWEEIYSQSFIHEKAKELLWRRRFLIFRAEVFCEDKSSLLNETLFTAAVQGYREAKKEFERMRNKFPRSYRRKLCSQYKLYYW